MVVVDAEVEIGVVEVLAVMVVSFDKELLVTAVSLDVELDAKTDKNITIILVDVLVEFICIWMLFYTYKQIDTHLLAADERGDECHKLRQIY